MKQIIINKTQLAHYLFDHYSNNPTNQNFVFKFLSHIFSSFLFCFFIQKNNKPTVRSRELELKTRNFELTHTCIIYQIFLKTIELFENVLLHTWTILLWNRSPIPKTEQLCSIFGNDISGYSVLLFYFGNRTFDSITELFCIRIKVLR